MENTWQPIINTGAIGAVALWMMFGMIPQLKQIEKAIDRLARAILVSVLAIGTLTDSHRHEAEGILRDIDDANAKRKP